MGTDQAALVTATYSSLAAARSWQSMGRLTGRAPPPRATLSKESAVSLAGTRRRGSRASGSRGQSRPCPHPASRACYNGWQRADRGWRLRIPREL